MFWIIPLVLIGGSLYKIGHIVWPKLKEVRQEKNLPEIKTDFWRLWVPEFYDFLERIDFRGFKRNTLNEYEKLLRRVKVLSLRTHNISDKLLEKRKRSGLKTEFKESSDRPEEKAVNAYFKTKENNLIAEIAKNPKDKNLYKSLATLYFENRMLKDAEEVLNVVLELDPNDLESMEALEKMEKII